MTDRKAILHRPAFTLIELTIVLMLMGILAGVAAPKFLRSLQQQRVASAARRIQADIELVRSTAMQTSSTQSITFAQGATYSLSSDIGHLDFSGDQYTVDLSAQPYGLAELKVDFTGGTTLSFDGFGNPSSGGNVSISEGGQNRRVVVDGTTGHVSIEIVIEVPSEGGTNQS